MFHSCWETHARLCFGVCFKGAVFLGGTVLGSKRVRAVEFDISVFCRKTRRCSRRGPESMFRSLWETRNLPFGQIHVWTRLRALRATFERSTPPLNVLMQLPCVTSFLRGQQTWCFERIIIKTAWFLRPCWPSVLWFYQRVFQECLGFQKLHFLCNNTCCWRVVWKHNF